jgi:hypothetical protein
MTRRTMNRKRTQMPDEERPVIPGFRAVEASREWKARVARETKGMTHQETVEYFHAAARRLRELAGRPVVAEEEAEYGEKS